MATRTIEDSFQYRHDAGVIERRELKLATVNAEKDRVRRELEQQKKEAGGVNTLASIDDKVGKGGEDEQVVLVFEELVRSFMIKPLELTPAITTAALLQPAICPPSPPQRATLNSAEFDQYNASIQKWHAARDVPKGSPFDLSSFGGTTDLSIFETFLLNQLKRQERL